MALAVRWSGPPSHVRVRILVEFVYEDDSIDADEHYPERGVDTHLLGSPDIDATTKVLISVFPEFDYWASTVEAPGVDGLVEVHCQFIDLSKSNSVWWPEAVGVRPNDRNGAGIRIGIIDGNVRTDTPTMAGIKHLGHATLPRFECDDIHGSLVASFLTGRSSDCQVPGLAAGAELFFISAVDRSGHFSENAVADGIEILGKDHGCDIVVVSAGDNDAPQPHIREAVICAREFGTICLFAAGNTLGDVGYPAKHEEVIAVAAMGRMGVLPEGSRMYDLFERDQDRLLADENGNYYISECLSFGMEVDLIAPGIGLLGDIGDGHLYPASGTSFAAPIAAAELAVALSTDKIYKQSSDFERFSRAAELLESKVKFSLFPGLAQMMGEPRMRPRDETKT